MSQDKMLTVRDVAIMLKVSEKDVLDLTESGAIPGYKIGGLYLRFKKEQVEQYKKTQPHLHASAAGQKGDSIGSRISDFFYFNDFYILAAILILFLGYLLYRGL